MSDQTPRKQFIPGSVVRVRGQLMGVGVAALRGLLDEAEDINDLPKAEVIAAREGVALEPVEDDQAELTAGQKAAATRAANKAKREAVIKSGKTPASVDAEGAEEESKLGDTSKAPVEPGTIGDGEPPEGTDEGETGRSQADGSEDPEAEEPDISDKATDAEVEAAKAEAGAPEPAPEFATQSVEDAQAAEDGS